MGEVYRAHDSRLGRDVAIKFSSEQFSERFEREARAVAALNHPNICTLHDVGPNYLVMEYVEGEAPHGPLPLDDVLRIAGQIAEALDAAHEKGIVHRDLKPANVKIKPDGTVKVLDFGLAKIANPPAVKTDDSPTIGMGATQAGIILGTAAYMSPEQARGKIVDPRADIWAFGVVLYELITGKQPFRGEDATEVLAAVVKEPPDLSAIPARVRRLLRTCLEKDPKKRLRAIGDWRLLLDDASSSTSNSRIAAAGWAVAFVGIIASAFALWMLWHKPSPSLQAHRFRIPRKSSQGRPYSEFALSPDGRYLAYFAAAAENGNVMRLFVQPLDSFEARPLPRTELPLRASPNYPFWSPDSRFVVFSSGGKVKRVEISGTPPQDICDFKEDGAFTGGTWNKDGVILFGRGSNDRGGMWRVLMGSTPSCAPFYPAKPGSNYDFPSFLPDGKHFLYTGGTGPGPENLGIYVGSLDAGPEHSKRLLGDLSPAAYAASPDLNGGYLVFYRGNSVLAQRFDPGRLELIGEAIPLGEPGHAFFFPSFSVSSNGLLAYSDANVLQTEPRWFDRQGTIVAKVAAPGTYLQMAVPPSGNRIAAMIHDNQTSLSDIWMIEPGGISSRITSGGRSYSPVFSFDGAYVVYGADSADIYQKRSDGGGDEELVYKSGEGKLPMDESRDGQFLLYGVYSDKTRGDLWVLPLQGERKPKAYLATEFNEIEAQFSPDTRWVAYESDESGMPDVYVRPFPDASKGKWPVSKGGGTNPRWRNDGRELYYLAPDQSVMAVEITSDPVFQVGAAKRLFFKPEGVVSGFNVASDGKKFMIPVRVGDSLPPPFTILFNWQTGLKQ
jgi:serine/threonine protein kinase